MVRRKGFTVVELLVALALVVFMMAILAEAFSVAAGSFRNLKAMGDLAERLRTAAGILRRDLAADHFEGKRRLSDPLFWTIGPPAEGFFRIYQDSPPSPVLANQPYPSYVTEGRNLDGVYSYRALDHALHFTVKLRGNGQGDYFSASVPAGSPLLNWNGTRSSPWTRYQDPAGTTFQSQWAEVIYFIQPQPNQFIQPDGEPSTAQSNPPVNVPLCTLYRRQLLLVPDTTENRVSDATNPATAYPEVNIASNVFMGPADVTIPWRRYGMTAPAGTFPVGSTTYQTLAQQNAAHTGADVLLSDVVSFEVRPFFYQTVLLPFNQTAALAISAGRGRGNQFVAPSPPPDRAQVQLSYPLVDLISVNPDVRSAFLPLNDTNLVLFAEFQDPNTKRVVTKNPSFYVRTRAQVQGPFVFDTWTQTCQTSEVSADYSCTGATPYWQGGLATSIPLYQNLSQVNPPPRQGGNPTQDVQPNAYLTLKAVQIVLRVWDYNTKQTRQVTIIQDL